jgi:hypothetical protein
LILTSSNRASDNISHCHIGQDQAIFGRGF